MTADALLALSYTDFVAWINQWNAPPGAHTTLSKWRIFGFVNHRSRLLDIACTTGFSTRELAMITGCEAVGIDISSASVASANRTKMLYAPDTRVQYAVANAYEYAAVEPFTHLILGASLGFFTHPARLIARIPSLLEDGGYLLGSPFYAIRPLPEDLVERARSIFGITVTRETHKDVVRLYADFEIIHADKNILVPETDEELDYYCRSTLSKLGDEMGDALTEEIRAAAYDRLLEIRRMSNEIRPYHGYTVLVLRYCRRDFGRRLLSHIN
jgi:SAM-dependent methyltransferase